MIGIGPEQKRTTVRFSYQQNGIAGYKDFHDLLPAYGVYRCLGVFIGVVNTVGWMKILGFIVK